MKHRRRTNHKNSQLFGLLIVLFGLLLLIDRLLPGLDFIDWIFSLPTILIIIGLLMRSRTNSNQTISLIFIAMGVVFLCADLLHWDTGRIIWPLIIIAAGLYVITGRRRQRNLRGPHPDDPDTDPTWDKRVDQEQTETEDSAGEETQNDFSKAKAASPEDTHETTGGQDFIESTSVFGNTRNFVVSKQFKGGDIVNIMGGSEINLTQADLQGPAVLEVVQLFGGTTIIAPAHWVVIPEMAAIFGGIEDKRYATAVQDKTKVLRIKGTSLFGGITIKSL